MKAVYCVLIVFLLTGCITASGKIFSEPESYSSEKATLYIYREIGYTHMAVCYSVRINGEKVGCLGNGSYILKEVNPGESNLSAALEDSFGAHSKLELSVNLKAGEKYFFKYTTEINYQENVDSGVGRRDFNIWLTGLVIPYKKGLFPVPEETALKELKELRLSM